MPSKCRGEENQEIRNLFNTQEVKKSKFNHDKKFDENALRKTNLNYVNKTSSRI